MMTTRMDDGRRSDGAREALVAAAGVAVRAVGVAIVAAGVAASLGGCPPPTGPRPGAPEHPVSVVRTAAAAPPASVPAPAPAPAPLAEPGFRAGEAALSPAERVGREIWFKATGGNGRFHTYVFQQRLGVLIDWYRVLGGPTRPERWKTFGLINDPDCCTPGSPSCPAKSMEETYGFDYCTGDDELMKHVGKPGYRDPACALKDVPATGAAEGRERQDACDLAFGTSTGALGFRKFPNPRFDAAKWKALNGGRLGTWDGYSRRLADDPALSDARVSHLLDGAVEPPFLVGMACGACHIAFDPLSPPADPTNPKWENIKGLVGNQYIRPSEIMASGMATDSPEWQIFTHARPGTVDTSAVPNDQVHNPGTMNALINIAQRPAFANETIKKWRRATACPEGEKNDVCWCEPGKKTKCWARSQRSDESVRHVLKGGEDSIGLEEAFQRVYFNIGMCAETCWLNHLTNLRELDPQQRNFGQTPFDVGQCRRDCPSFRAVEDRLPEVASFILSKEARPTDLALARDPDPTRPLAVKRKNLVAALEKELGKDAVARGRSVFAANCARCHSSQEPPFQTRDFLEEKADDPSLRVDWMGNDKATGVSEVGTFACRALHSNHMQGHVWEQYGSESYRARPVEPGAPALSDGGRGYYRNISLLSAWAHAPFMHNNAIGPELCGNPSNKRDDFYRSPYVDASLHPLASPAACVPYDASVEGRFALFKQSMDSLLNPGARVAKASLLDHPIRLDIGPRTWDGNKEKRIFGITIEFPAGTPASFFGNFQHKELVVDLVESKTDQASLKARLKARLGSEEKAEAAARAIGALADDLLKQPTQLVTLAREQMPLLEQLYLSCRADVENAGHRFGEDLPAADKKALTAFLATL